MGGPNVKPAVDQKIEIGSRMSRVAIITAIDVMETGKNSIIRHLAGKIGILFVDAQGVPSSMKTEEDIWGRIDKATKDSNSGEKLEMGLQYNTLQLALITNKFGEGNFEEYLKSIWHVCQAQKLLKQRVGLMAALVEEN